jgi:hypothetical protein
MMLYTRKISKIKFRSEVCRLTGLIILLPRKTRHAVAMYSLLPRKTGHAVLMETIMYAHGLHIYNMWQLIKLQFDIQIDVFVIVISAFTY